MRVTLVTTEELEDMLERGDALVVNVLSREDFRNEHIPGSHNVPVNDADFAAQVKSLTEAGAPVVVYCSGPDCGASPRAARELIEAGFTDVYHYRGGMAEWRAAHAGQTSVD